jgi:hypothetical protein
MDGGGEGDEVLYATTSRKMRGRSLCNTHIGSDGKRGGQSRPKPESDWTMPPTSGSAH